MLNRRIHTVLDLAVIAAYCSTIFLLSSIPQIKQPFYPFANFDIILHIILYGGLGLIICRFLANDLRRSAPAAMIVACALTMLYGLSDEIHQSFVPGRNVSVSDFISNTTGAVLAVLFWYFAMRPRTGPALLLLRNSTEDDKQDELQV